MAHEIVSQALINGSVEFLAKKSQKSPGDFVFGTCFCSQVEGRVRVSDLLSDLDIGFMVWRTLSFMVL